MMLEEFKRKQAQLAELMEWVTGAVERHREKFGNEPETLFGKKLSEFTTDELIETIRNLKEAERGTK